jgi:hypothetical protein
MNAARLRHAATGKRQRLSVEQNQYGFKETSDSVHGDTGGLSIDIVSA